ncbi:glycosyl hydrolase [Clostridium chrysemydis]|uniref:glycosyl hydrolase n=1 Tax=Clostridium chrysemydis TaxID=2665504 RepID=UPI001883826F|nr:glycosyl hydrolase [Clostridium chrysemydis]
MSKFKITGIVLFAFLILLIGVRAIMPYIIPIESKVVFNNNPVSDRETILFDFIKKDMTNQNGGIKTNFKKELSEGDITKGDAVLSESEGMMLQYYLDRGDTLNFNKTLEFIKDDLKLKNGLVSWRLEGDKKAESSATIDDLRIVKALLLADERFKGIKYRMEAISISNSIYKNLVVDDSLIDFEDPSGKSKKTTLCYLDLPTLKYLNNIDSKWKFVFKNAKTVINNGFISDKVPLYSKYYENDTKKYDTENPDTLLSSIIILNKAEIGDDVSKSVNFIKEKFKKDGAIYAVYDRNTGEKASKVESTSIYSLLLRIASKVNDTELYNLALNKLEDFQVLNKDSEIYGGYGDPNTLTVYSFDNLNALLAYRDVK